jgi:hypothetical protein
MPTISIFFGIVIRMYYGDHAPAHFHAFYQGHEALVAIETLEVIAGELPRRALELVFDWTELHRMELMDNWQKAQEHLPLENIEPLE